MRLFCRILDNGIPFCHDRGHDDIDGRADGDDIHIDMAADKAGRFRAHMSGRHNRYVRAKCPEALDMLVNRAQADIAAAGQSHFRLAVLAEEGSDQVVGTADLPDGLVIYRLILDIRSVNYICMSFRVCDFAADVADCSNQRADVADIRNIFYGDRLICHDCSCHDRKRRVFRAGNFNFAGERAAAFHDIIFHAELLNLFF